MEEVIKNEIKEHIEVINKSLDLQEGKIKEIVDLILNCYRDKGKVVLFGNGGSAADAQHIAAELVGKYKMERKSLPAIALSTNTSIMSAIGNDYGFDKVFERQVESMVNENDVVIGISTSGNSENVLRGIIAAKEIGAKTIAFTGNSGGKLKGIVDILLNIPSENNNSDSDEEFDLNSTRHISAIPLCDDKEEIYKMFTIGYDGRYLTNQFQFNPAKIEKLKSGSLFQLGQITPNEISKK